MYVCVSAKIYVCEWRMYVCESARMNYGLNGPSYYSVRLQHRLMHLTYIFTKFQKHICTPTYNSQ